MASENETVGNTAKLREALETLVDIVDAWKDHLPPVIRDGELSKAIKKAEAALAAPPRNCDVGTAEEQKERFEEFCDDEKGDRQHCRNCRLCNALDCELAWAQMPYKGGAK